MGPFLFMGLELVLQKAAMLIWPCMLAWVDWRDEGTDKLAWFFCAYFIQAVKEP